MKLLLFVSVLLSGFVAAAQNNVPNWFDPSSTQGTSSKRNSDLCYAIRMFKVVPEEKVQPYLEAPRQTTCIPANRYRTEYIPNPTNHPAIIRTGALQRPAGRGQPYKSIFEMFLLYSQVLH